MNKIRWGITGTGKIAHTFAKELLESEKCELIAIGSRTKEKAEKFAGEFKIKKAYGTYEELMADKDVEAVYISTPHPMHCEWAIKAAKAKKHILCEKPIGINYAEALAIIEAAHENDVFLMEAFMYRCHPQTRKLVELLTQKAIGEVRVIHASFSFQAAFNPESRLFNNALAGGGILDVGCYCVSMARLIAGVANGKDFIEPLEVKGFARIGQTGVDEYASALMKFPPDIIATVSSGVSVTQENAVRIFGSAGSIFIPSPWFCGNSGIGAEIFLTTKGKQEKIIIEDKRLYSIEADTVAGNISRRKAPFPAMSPEDSAGNMKTCDLWRISSGCIYDMEKPHANIPTASREKITLRKNNKMKYLSVPGLDKKISQFVMGTTLEGGTILLPYATVMYDDFFERGGNCFDTSYIYGGGICEKILGQWIMNRALRKEIVILGKGAHTPDCNPSAITRQLEMSLERLQTDYVDIYMMHRDNPDIPAGEFIDVLNEHVKAGRIKVFGGSNWSIKRVDEANRYARKKGRQGFSAISNNLSLARSVEPLWEGCISSSDKQSRTWFTKNNFANFSWSCQARGFFSGRAKPDYKDDAELVRSWYCEDNFERLRRAEQLAKIKKTLPITIAAAYVLSQPFPSFAIIGPRTPAETRTSLDALEVNLTAEEAQYLNLETDKIKSG